MSNSQDFQDYDSSTLQWNLGQDGITYVQAPTGEVIHTVAWFPLPEGNLDKGTIDQLVSEFRSGVGRGANKAICSKCYDEGNYVAWDPKPASLKRHLYTHYQIKCYACKYEGCIQRFFTKDQTVVHVINRHLKQQNRGVAATYVVSLY